MVSAEAAFDAVQEMSELELEGVALVEFSLLDEEVYSSFANAAHSRWGA